MKQAPSTAPLILALETATPVASVALFRGAELLALQEVHTGRAHARLIAPMIQHLLADLRIQARELAAIGVAKGPGSYTGLRVGVSTAKGLCLALNVPLLAMSSLESLAWPLQSLAQHQGAWICPMIDARRMEVFMAAYDAHMEIQLPIQAKIMSPGVLDEWLEENKMIFVGDGVAKCKEMLGAHPHAILLSDRKASARGMGQALLAKYEREEFEDLVRFEPFYLKDFVATKPKRKVNP